MEFAKYLSYKSSFLIYSSISCLSMCIISCNGGGTASNSPHSTNQVKMITTVTGCAIGNGLDSVCYNSPDSMGGTASKIEVVLTFTNAANKQIKSLEPVSINDFNKLGYTQISNTCDNGLAANNGTCEIRYKISSQVKTKFMNANISNNNFIYKYNYNDSNKLKVCSSNCNDEAQGAGVINIAIEITEPRLRIVVTNNTYDGNLGGFTGADSKCESDENVTSLNSTHSWKALLTGNSATISGNTYYRSDGTTKIATATNGELVGDSSLDTAISEQMIGVWTGGYGSNCSNWQQISYGGSGGWANANNNTWYKGILSENYWTPCSSRFHLYCVEQ